jgi:hypothetical protein
MESRMDARESMPSVASSRSMRCGSEPVVRYIDVDWPQLPDVARRLTLSAYDAACLQLALNRPAPLVTLDAKLAAEYDRAAVGRP